MTDAATNPPVARFTKEWCQREIKYAYAVCSRNPLNCMLDNLYDMDMWDNIQPCVSKDSFDALQSNMDTCVKTRRNPELTVLYRDSLYPYDKTISIFYKADIELQTKQLAILEKNMT